MIFSLNDQVQRTLQKFCWLKKTCRDSSTWNEVPFSHLFSSQTVFHNFTVFVWLFWPLLFFACWYTFGLLIVCVLEQTENPQSLGWAGHISQVILLSSRLSVLVLRDTFHKASWIIYNTSHERIIRMLDSL